MDTKAWLLGADIGFGIAFLASFWIGFVLFSLSIFNCLNNSPRAFAWARKCRDWGIGTLGVFISSAIWVCAASPTEAIIRTAGIETVLLIPLCVISIVRCRSGSRWQPTS